MNPVTTAQTTRELSAIEATHCGPPDAVRGVERGPVAVTVGERRDPFRSETGSGRGGQPVKAGRSGAATGGDGPTATVCLAAASRPRLLTTVTVAVRAPAEA